jgi:hypothetical protein
MRMNAVLLCLGAGSALPREAHANLKWGPALDFEVRQDELQGSDSSDEGWIARLSPRLTLTRTDVRSTLEVMGTRSFDSNQRLSGPTWVGDELGLRFDSTPGPRSAFSTYAGYNSSRDPLGNKAAGPVTFSESAIATGGARLELWRLEGGYQVRSHTYAAPNQLDGFSQSWEAALFPYRRPDMRAVLAVRGRDVRIAREPALNTEVLTAGMQRTHYAGLSSELEVGAAATRDPIRGTNQWDFALVAGANVDHGALSLPFDLRFRLAHDVANTGFVEASLPGRRSRLSARWEQNLGAEGGYFQDITLSRYMTFEARDTLMRDYSLTLQGSFGQTRTFFVDGPWLKTQRVWASLSRSLAPWLSAGLDYSFVNQDGDSSVPSWVFQRNRLGLRLTVGAQ